MPHIHMILFYDVRHDLFEDFFDAFFQSVFSILTRLYPGLPSHVHARSGFRYCSIPISSMIWSNTLTGSYISSISEI